MKEPFIADFTIPGKPTPLKRHRHTKRGFSYDPSKKDKEAFAMQAMQYRPQKPLEGPIRIRLMFYMPIPKSYSKKRKLAIVGKPHIFTPDSDNLAKFVFDALNGIFYKDDCQIFDDHSMKIYSQTPGTNIIIQAV